VGEDIFNDHLVQLAACLIGVKAILLENDFLIFNCPASKLSERIFGENRFPLSKGNSFSNFWEQVGFFSCKEGKDDVVILNILAKSNSRA